MLKIGTETKLKPEEVIERALKFFGPDSPYSLKVSEQTDTTICFEGGGGGVEVVACTGDSETTFDVISREWDVQVKEFMTKIKQRKRPTGRCQVTGLSHGA